MPHSGGEAVSAADPDRGRAVALADDIARRGRLRPPRGTAIRTRYEYPHPRPDLTTPPVGPTLAAAPQHQARGSGQVPRKGTKTARFLDLATERHGLSPSFPAPRSPPSAPTWPPGTARIRGRQAFRLGT